MTSSLSPIEARLPYDAAVPAGTQVAFHAVVHLVIPCVDAFGTPVGNVDDACDYVSETLRDQFLDWGYVVAVDLETGAPVEGAGRHQVPVAITVCEPYVEGTFLDDPGAPVARSAADAPDSPGPQ